MWILGVQLEGCLQYAAFNAAVADEVASRAGDRFVRLIGGGCTSSSRSIW